MDRTNGGFDQSVSKFSLHTLYSAARMYYIEQANQADIAARLDVSRPTVSRLLSEARRIGLVKIDVIEPFAQQNSDLASALADALKLDKAYVTTDVRPGLVGTGLSLAVTQAIKDMELDPGDVLLISSGKTIYEASLQPLPSLPGVILVPTVGGVDEPEPWFQTNEITRRMAEVVHGKPALLFTQAMPSEALYESTLEDPAYQRLTRLWESAKGALLGVGSPPMSRETISRFIPTDATTMQHAVGDCCLQFFDENGDPVPFPGSDRIVGTSLEILKSVPFSTALAVGEEKVLSIYAGAKAGFYTRLVTDASTARLLIEHANAAKNR